MPATKSNRGRPKGTGLDDRSRLTSIANLIQADPSLKPTTAIKSLGISDPSTIRRLRDKYRKFQNEMAMKPSSASAIEHPKMVAKSPAVSAATRRQRPASKRPPSARNTTQQQSPRATSGQLAADAAVAEPANWFGIWCGIGMHSVSTAMELNIAAYQQALSIPQVAWAFKNQLAFRDLALSFYNAQSSQGFTVH